MRQVCTSAIFLLAVVALGSRGHAAEPVHAKPPWHLVDLWWDLGRDVPFESYSIDVRIDDEPPGGNLYLAPLGLAHLGETQCYGGMQTQIDGYSLRDPKLRKLGPGMLFSMWGERKTEAIRPAEGGYYQSSGHEGDFVSVRRPYAWTKGTYTFRLVRMDKDIAGKAPAVWVGAFLYSHQKNENIFVGALRFPGDDLILKRRVASFVEIYGEEIPVSKIPKLTVAFGNLKVNGQPVKSPAVEAVYPDKVPDYAQATASDGGVTITLGSLVPNRSERHIRLSGR